MLIERNELSKNSKGGTESQATLLEKYVNNDLLSEFQIICSRVRELNPDKKKVLWLHDIPNDPESRHFADPKSVERFDGIVCVSNWQLQMYNVMYSLPYSKTKVIQNAIEPIFIEKKFNSDTPIRLIYHTTPHRGLKILVPVFKELCKHFDDIELDVFSSFKIYGWDERDNEFADVFEQCRNHPKIRYHGYQPNEVVRQALIEADIFAYPSVWPETSCIAAIEAMSAGCVAVMPNYAALPETSANWSAMYQWSENTQENAQRFCDTLVAMITNVRNAKQNPEHELNNRQLQQSFYFNNFYNWDRRKVEWEDYLVRLSNNK